MSQAPWAATATLARPGALATHTWKGPALGEPGRRADPALRGCPRALPTTVWETASRTLRFPGDVPL